MVIKKPVNVRRVRENLRRAAEASGMTWEEIGVRMGLAKGGARQSVSRLLNIESNYDPRLSTLLAFCKAIERPLENFLS